MKSQLIIPFSLLFILILLGLATLHGEVLALALPIIVYIGTAVLFSPGIMNLSVSREISNEWVSAGTPVIVNVTLQNDGAMIDEILISDTLPPAIELVDGKNILMTTISPESKHVLTYTVRGPRGDHSSDYLKIQISETFGLFRKEIDLNSRFHINIRPDIPKIRSIHIQPYQTRSFSGQIPSRKGGAGVGFFSMREYQPGDSQKHINWKVAARHSDELFTNTYQMERVADVGLILDARSHVYVTKSNDTLFEHSVQATAALANYFLNDGNRVGLLIYGEVLRSVLPGYGRIQRERILKTLAGANSGLHHALKNLGFLPTRIYPPKSQIVLISPLTSEDVTVLGQLRTLGYSVMLVCPYVFTYQHKVPCSSDNKDINDSAIEFASRLIRIERTFLLKKVRSLGVQVIDWNINKSLDDSIQEAMLRQPSRYFYQGGMN